MTNRPQPPRMPVQLVRPETERAQCSAADGMTAHSRNAYWPSCGHLHFHPTTIRAQGASRLLYFDRAARGLWNPRPVLTPDGSVVEQLPGHRRYQETRGRSRAPYQQISSRNFHAAPFSLLLLFMATKASRLDVVAAMAAFAVAHLHALVRRTPQARNGMPPDVAAVSANAVDLVSAHLIRLAIG